MTHGEYEKWKYREIFEDRFSIERLLKIARYAAERVAESVGSMTLAEAEAYLSSHFADMSFPRMWAARAVTHAHPGRNFSPFQAVSDAADCLRYKDLRASVEIMTELVDAALTVATAPTP